MGLATPQPGAGPESCRIVLRDPVADRWLEFGTARALIAAHTPAEVVPALRALEARVDGENLHAAGFVAYEAAAAFDPALVTRAGGTQPLLCFGLFDAPRLLDELPEPAPADTALPEWHIDTGKDDYRAAIRHIRRQIELGNTYQVNYTIRAQARGIVDPWQLFLQIAADAPHAAYVEFGARVVVSASPELFFRLDGDALSSRPMKGTARRGLTTAADLALRDRLQASSKDRAENVMIADMIRNDMGRIAAAGSVATTDLFRIEKYRTVWQMTTTVSARTEAPVSAIFGALFPCASVTGAPKVSSMRLIAGLERTPRQVYTGAIGWLAPKRRASFSVGIRTATLDRASGAASYGIGGGVVWHSDEDDEYDECLAKAGILKQRPPPRDFELLETLRWTEDEGYFLLDRHLRRLASSARYFDFDCDRQRLLDCLDARAARLGGGRHRVRLLLGRDGRCRAESAVLPPQAAISPLRVRIAATPVEHSDPFLYHKTTWRDCYERPRADMPDCDDVLLWNADGDVTETTLANVVVRIDGSLCTPPVDCGLLAGTYREWLLETGRVAERRIALAELQAGAEILLVNSVRGEMPAVVAGPPAAGVRG